MKQNKKTSAYFDESESSLSNIDKINGFDNPLTQSIPFVDCHIIDFPRRADILWDRSPLTAYLQIQSADVYYPLLIGISEAKHLLSLLHSNTEGEGIDFSVDLLSRRNNTTLQISQSPYVFALSKNSSNILRAQILQSPSLLSQCMRANSPCTLTIPIVRITDQRTGQQRDEIQFSNDSTSNLISNMVKSIRFGRDFSLRTLFRIRGKGFLHNQDHSLGHSPYKALIGSLYLEAIYPNISVSFHRIAPIPILSTTLSIRLMSLCSNSPASMKSDSTDEIDSRRKQSIAHGRGNREDPVDESLSFGYLTMNQTRKIVFVLENDESISRIPVVGVWVCIHQHEDLASWDDIMRHPFVWGACVRFTCSEHLKKRIQLADSAFLLTILRGSEIFYFEVKAFSGSSGSLTSNSLTSPDAFVRLDYTVDLNLDDEDSSDTNGHPDLIVCRFKPVIDKQIAHANSNLWSGGYNGMPSSVANNNYRSENKDFLPFSHRHIHAGGTHSFEASTPVPRSQAPLPSPPSRFVQISSFHDGVGYPGSHGNGSKAAPEYTTNEEDDIMLLENHLRNSSTGASTYPTGNDSFSHNSEADNTHTTAAMIIASQQQQIAALRREVEELKAIIEKMHSNGHVDPPTRHDLSPPPPPSSAVTAVAAALSLPLPCITTDDPSRSAKTNYPSSSSSSSSSLQVPADRGYRNSSNDSILSNSSSKSKSKNTSRGPLDLKAAAAAAAVLQRSPRGGGGGGGGGSRNLNNVSFIADDISMLSTGGMSARRSESESESASESVAFANPVKEHDDGDEDDKSCNSSNTSSSSSSSSNIVSIRLRGMGTFLHTPAPVTLLPARRLDYHSGSASASVPATSTTTGVGGATAVAGVRYHRSKHLQQRAEEVSAILESESILAIQAKYFQS